MNYSSVIARCAHRTACGTKHGNNEDAIFVVSNIFAGTMDTTETLTKIENYPNLFLIADGLGGHDDGHLASQFVAAAIGNRFMQCSDTASLRAMLEDVNRELFKCSESLNQARPMGCTSAGLILMRESVIIFGVGDCSIFRFRASKIEQLTKVSRTADSAIKVTHSFGGTHTIEPLDPDIDEVEVAVGDRYLICSDGLSDAVPSSEIKAVEGMPLCEAVDYLFSRAWDEGATDDISVILLDIRGESERTPDVSISHSMPT